MRARAEIGSKSGGKRRIIEQRQLRGRETAREHGNAFTEQANFQEQGRRQEPGRRHPRLRLHRGVVCAKRSEPGRCQVDGETSTSSSQSPRARLPSSLRQVRIISQLHQKHPHWQKLLQQQLPFQRRLPLRARLFQHDRTQQQLNPTNPLGKIWKWCVRCARACFLPLKPRSVCAETATTRSFYLDCISLVQSTELTGQGLLIGVTYCVVTLRREEDSIEVDIISKLQDYEL